LIVSLVSAVRQLVVTDVAVGSELWETAAKAVGCTRVARKASSAAVIADKFRSPNVVLLLGNDACVEHIDNGIRSTIRTQRFKTFTGDVEY